MNPMPRATNPGAITVAVMLATFLAALDTSVVGTAMPTIIGDLGGLDLYSWVFSAYLLTSTTAVPVFGRLSDMYGRKAVFSAGTALFLAGSVLCGSAGNMEQLIAFRAIQGLGAAAVLPTSMTVVGDIFGVVERARVQGLLSAVWGVSAILGPGLGGFIVDKLQWRWLFYVNIPFGLLSVLLLTICLREKPVPGKRPIDYTGAVALLAAIAILLFGLLELGQSLSTIPMPAWTLVVAGIGLLALFLWHESRVAEPLLPIGLFKNRLFSVSNASGFLAGATLMGMDSFVPPFIQGVLGGTAINAGAVLAPMSISWTIASAVSGRMMVRHGYRPVVMLGAALSLVGALMLAAPVDRGVAQMWLMLAMLVTGFGMGFSITSFLVAVQSSVGWSERGIATASISFFQNIGGAVGVSVMGAVMNSGMHQGLLSLGPTVLGPADGIAGVSAASVVLDPVARSSIPAATLEALRVVLASSLRSVYSAIAIASLAGLAMTFLFPRGCAGESEQETGGNARP